MFARCNFQFYSRNKICMISKREVGHTALESVRKAEKIGAPNRQFRPLWYLFYRLRHYMYSAGFIILYIFYVLCCRHAWSSWSLPSLPEMWCLFLTESCTFSQNRVNLALIGWRISNSTACQGCTFITQVGDSSTWQSSLSWNFLVFNSPCKST